MFSAMIWTVHFAYDNVGWPSFERAAQMINDTGKFRVFNKILRIWLPLCDTHWRTIPSLASKREHVTPKHDLIGY